MLLPLIFAAKRAAVSHAAAPVQLEHHKFLKLVFIISLIFISVKM